MTGGTVAARVFAAQLEMGIADEAACDALLVAAGIAPNSPKDWPFDDTTYDYYDESFEWKDVTPGWEPTESILAAWWALGFRKCWMCYADGTEQIYYRPGA